jgi:type II secretory pathway pseudopilin PulG
MIIIGILAAIAIPVFLNQRTKARETSAKADVNTIGKEIAAYYVDGVSALSVTSAAGVWTLKDETAGTTVTTGNLSGNNVAVGDKAKILSGDQFCVAVTSYPSAADAAAGTKPDQTWSFTQAGLKKAAC